MPTRPANIALDNEQMSLHWEHESAKVTLSYIPFFLEQYSCQTFWSYNIFIDPQSHIDLEKVIDEVKAQAQSLSDWKILPSPWEFGADSISVLDPNASPDGSLNGSPALQRLLLLLCFKTC